MQRTPDGSLIVSATDLVGFVECGHLTLLDRAMVAGLVGKPNRGDDPALELLRRRGGEHEQRYIAQLRAKGRPITDLTASEGLSYAERAAATEQAMRQGDDVIFQATVYDGRWLGHPDFLLRVEGASAVGDWHYEVADTKLAHSAKASALIQICSYVEQVERIQGVRPEHVYVVTSGAEIEEHRFRTAEMMAYYRHAKGRFEGAIDDARAGAPSYPVPRANSYPDPVEHCAVCKWFYVECRQAWRDDDALPLVAGISRNQRKELSGLGFDTRALLAEAQVERRFERVRDQARVQVKTGASEVPAYELLPPETDGEGRLVTDRGLAALPSPSEHDLFFDIEGDPFAFWEGLEYLFGVWDGSSYRQIWAMTRAQEKQAFEQVVDLFHDHWQAHPEMHTYHYGVYEPSRFKTLAGRHSTRQDELDAMLRAGVFVDLYRVVRQGMLVGSERYSIKNLEPLYGFTREIELRDANSSIVEFELLLEQDDPSGEIKDKIAAYNKDDTVSTQLLRDWLEARRPDAERAFEVTLPRPPIGTPEPLSEDLSERIRAARDLEARLTAEIDPDPARQTEADKATWLVANLLEWHRREDKSAWWRYYDLIAKSDDELLDETEPIGGLKPDGSYDPGGRSRSTVHRYRFPPQEHKVELGDVDDPRIEGRHKRTGAVVALDEKAGTLEIRRLKTWDGVHPHSLIQINTIDAKAQRLALMRLGNWVAEHGIDSPEPGWQAARDLIRRRVPRIVGHSGAALTNDGETGAQAARRLAPLLDGTTLAIQGPPGSGKTHTGARMILDLVRGGKKVGITSNSHKVICNLIEAVIEAVPAGEQLRIVQKGKEHEAFSHAWVRRVDDNGDVDDALADGSADIAAGTPWLWAREELAGALDTLFVDEAGQVSLANVVAISGAARNVVLLGDPQQLDQPTQGVHPDGAGVSALGHFLNTAKVVPPERGLFLERTYRMHPDITAYTSELFYEGRLESVAGLEQQRIGGDGEWSGSGLRWVAVEHSGNSNGSAEEAAKVVEIIRSLIGREWIDASGTPRILGPAHFRVVSPFNAHRLLIEEHLRAAGVSGVPVGTVDKFQGQQAPVSIYTMASSSPADAPRGVSFLYSLNRLNVATSRAKALAIVIASPALLSAVPRTPDQLRMVNGLNAFVQHAPAATAEPDEPNQLSLSLR